MVAAVFVLHFDCDDAEECSVPLLFAYALTVCFSQEKSFRFALTVCFSHAFRFARSPEPRAL